MEQNKTGKYFKYAIGEIILVVIGILIALSINNWNENRKEAILELAILKEVGNGLITDLIDVNYNFNVHKDKLVSQKIIIDWIQSNSTFHDSLSSHIGIIHYGTYFASKEGPYQALKQIGLRTIKNDSLRNQITNLYDLTYPFYNIQNRKYEELTDRMVLQASKYFNELDFFGDKMKPNNITDLKLDNSYLYHLKTTTNLNEILIFQIIPRVNDEITKALDMINEELENRN